jgi:flavin reductase (DIM6/NTAB) family NADH-FMN oxidoreductase RutF
LFDEQAADAEDQALDLVAVPDCAAYLVCKVESSCPASEQPVPRVQAHNVLFCRVQRAYVHRSYWINGNNFAPSTPHTPPYLTFLGSGKFGHVVLPEHATWARMSHEPLYSQAH